MFTKTISCLACIFGLMPGTNLVAELLVEEGFEGYPDNALISAHPAGDALGLQGDWFLDSESDFYVNRTQLNLEEGTGKAVYDRPSDDNGKREAMRLTSENHVLLSQDGDVFFAGFLAHPSRSTGHMTMELQLTQLSGGGQRSISFGIIDGEFIVGNGGVEVDASGGNVIAEEMMLTLRVENGDGHSGPDDTDRVTLWVNTDHQQQVPVIDDVGMNLLNRGGARLTAVSIRGEHMAGYPAFFDNLRVATQLADILATQSIPSLSGWAIFSMLVLIPLAGMVSIKVRSQQAPDIIK